jgi:hypothetical protein
MQKGRGGAAIQAPGSMDRLDGFDCGSRLEYAAEPFAGVWIAYADGRENAFRHRIGKEFHLQITARGLLN